MSNCYDRFVMIEGEEDSFETWQGLRGPYYTPSVSEDGTLSWTNNGGLPNPANVNIKGPPGPGGIPGGTTGQLLAKSSDEDYDAEWIDPPEMDAGHVSYDKTETYPDESVGDELNTIDDTLDIQEVYNTAFGDIASFNTPASAPLTSLVAQIEPVQDLHGYDAPWAGGAGVNKFNPASAIIDGQWISGSGSVGSADSCHTPLMVCTSGEKYTISASPASGDPPYSWSFVWYSGETFLQRDHTQSTSSAFTKTAPTGADNFLVQIAKATGSPVTLTLAELEAYKIQLELGSSATTWKPYANECPISGWTGLSGYKLNGNLFNGVFGTGETARVEIPTGATAFTATAESTSAKNLLMRFYDSEGTKVGSDVTLISAGASRNIRSVTIPSGATLFSVYYQSGGSASEFSNVCVGIGGTFSVSWQDEAGTVYGGTVDVVSGLLTAEKVIETKIWSNGTSATNLGSVTRKAFALQNACVDNDPTDISNIAIRDGRYAWDSTHFYINGTNTRAYVYLPNDTSGDTEIQLCYSLAQPLTYQLSPQQVLTLVGQNNVFVDTGSVSVTYFAGTESALDQKVDKVEGKGLSTNDFTDAEKTKLAGIEAQANKTVIDATLSNQGQAADAKATGDAISLKAPVIVDTDSGAIATYPDGMEAPMRSLLATIEPVQDLHGYDAPWAAGAGANQWDEQWEGGDISAETGINEGNAQMIRSVGYIPVDASKTYYFFCGSISSTNVRARFYDQNKSYIGYSPAGGTFVQVNESFTPPSGAYYMRFAMQPVYGTTYQNDISVNYPATVTTYAPYSNECPISGWTGLSGKRGGKNLIPNLKYRRGTNYVYLGQDVNQNYFNIHLKPGTYTMSCNNSVKASLNMRGANDTATTTIHSSRVNNYGTITLTKEGDYQIWLYNGEGITVDDVTEFQLEVGETVTTYEPYITPTSIECSWFGVLGKNLFDPAANPDKWINASGQLVDVTGAKASQKIPCSQGDSFAVSTESGVSTLAICFYASDDSVTQRTAQQDVSSLTATAPANTAYVISATYGESGKEVQLERGTSATAYEAYKNTVYGGRVDVVSGAMVVDRAKLVLDSTIPSGTNGFRNISVLTNGVRAEYYPYRAVGLANSVILSDKFKYGLISDGTPFYVGTSETNPRMYITLPLEYDTEEEIRAWFASNPSEFVYYLATPQTYQLTPQQVTQLFGNNSVWVDCGSVTVVSPRDTKLYIDKKLG